MSARPIDSNGAGQMGILALRQEGHPAVKIAPKTPNQVLEKVE